YEIISYFFFSSRRRHTRSKRDWSSDVCSSDLHGTLAMSFILHLLAGSLVRWLPLLAHCNALAIIIVHCHTIHKHIYSAVHIRLGDRKSTRLNSSHVSISYAVFCLKKKISPRSQ